MQFSGKDYLANIIKKIENVGGEVDMDTLDTNGWDVDYWIDFDLDGKTYTISGSMFYGNFSIGEKEE